LADELLGLYAVLLLAELLSTYDGVLVPLREAISFGLLVILELLDHGESAVVTCTLLVFPLSTIGALTSVEIVSLLKGVDVAAIVDVGLLFAISIPDSFPVYVWLEPALVNTGDAPLLELDRLALGIIVPSVLSAYVPVPLLPYEDPFVEFVEPPPGLGPEVFVDPSANPPPPTKLLLPQPQPLPYGLPQPLPYGLPHPLP
jgi:hypothetical protein